MPESMASEWTELTFLQLQAGNQANFVFALAVVSVGATLSPVADAFRNGGPGRITGAGVLAFPLASLGALVSFAMPWLSFRRVPDAENQIRQIASVTGQITVNTTCNVLMGPPGPGLFGSP